MKKIIGSPGTGKSRALMETADAESGVYVCSDVLKAKIKASSYGLSNLDIISYRDYFLDNYDMNKPVYIDEIENYLETCEYISGFSFTI